MITLTCDNCDKRFEIEDDAAGQRVACPYCGDVNRVPASASADASESGLAVGRVVEPSVQAASVQKPAADQEQQITVIRQAMFRAHPFWYLLMVLVFFGGLTLTVLSKTWSQIPQPHVMMWVGLGLAFVALIWWLIWWAAPHRWIKLIITNKRTIRQEGIVVRKTSEVLHNHIRNVKIEQSFLQRILGVGSISIDSAGGEQEQMVEIQMDNVPQPYKVKEIFDRYRRM